MTRASGRHYLRPGMQNTPKFESGGQGGGSSLITSVTLLACVKLTMHVLTQSVVFTCIKIRKIAQTVGSALACLFGFIKALVCTFSR